MKIFKNFCRLIVEYLSGKSYVPLNSSELIDRLNIPSEHVALFRQSLKSLKKKGTLEFKQKRYSLSTQNAQIATGTLSVHPRGFAFLQPDDPLLFEEDIFIPKHLTGNAVNGDVVEVLVSSKIIADKGPEGKVIAILKRARTHIAGTVLRCRSDGSAYAYVPLFGLSREVLVHPSTDFALKIGDRVVMKINDWGDRNSPVDATAYHYLGHISDPSCDIKAAVEEFELRSDFSSKVLSEVKAFGTRVQPKEIKKRVDFRERECFTIDPETAKDFDDALSLHQDKNHHYHLAVHIADVAHYVQADSFLDKEAKKRCNSTYFPGFCLPMLPPALSENLCSLKPNVNRLTVSVLMEFDPAGQLIHYDIVRGVIKSCRRFTYREAKNIIDGKQKSKYSNTLQLMASLCKLLKKKRYTRGCLEFALPEARVCVDEQGNPEKIELVEYDIAHQLVEEFMINANEVIATHLSKQGKDLTYRIHEEPDENNMKDFASIAGAYGFDLSETPQAKELQDLFDQARQSPFGQHLAICYIRSMKLAYYSPTNIGHYGLSLDHYCHFTSPIRRYADLTIHRQLVDEALPTQDFQSISMECSDQERISAKAENAVIVLKKLRLLDKLVKKQPHRQFQAVITKVKPFGFFFEVEELMLEGLLRLSELDDDYFLFEEKQLRLRGDFTGIQYSCGNKITVMLADLDFITLECHWHLVPHHPKRKKRKRK